MAWHACMPPQSGEWDECVAGGTWPPPRQLAQRIRTLEQERTPWQTTSHHIRREKLSAGTEDKPSSRHRRRLSVGAGETRSHGRDNGANRGRHARPRHHGRPVTYRSSSGTVTFKHLQPGRDRPHAHFRRFPWRVSSSPYERRSGPESIAPSIHSFLHAHHLPGVRGQLKTYLPRTSSRSAFVGPESSTELGWTSDRSPTCKLNVGFSAGEKRKIQEMAAPAPPVPMSSPWQSGQGGLRQHWTSTPSPIVSKNTHLGP